MTQVESNCSSYLHLLHCVQLTFFFASTLCWNFSTRNLDFCKSSYPWVIVYDVVLQGLPGFPGPGRARVKQRPLQGPHPGLRSVCLLPDTQGTRHHPGPLTYGAGSHSSHKGWMPNCYFWGLIFSHLA